MIVMSVVAFLSVSAWLTHILRIRYRARLTQEYLTGIRDGQMIEARINQATAPKILTVTGPLMGRN